MLTNLVIVAGIGIALSFLLAPSTLPYPYDAYNSEPIPQSHLPFFPGAGHAPTSDLFENKSEAWRSGVRRLFEGQVEGVESVAVAQDGKLVLLDKYGYVHVAVALDTSTHPAEVAYTLDGKDEFKKFYIGPGRPLGFHVLESADDELVLLVCDSLKGLLQVNLSQRTIEVLSNIADDGKIINYANDLDIGPESGKVYFTSSTEGVVGWNGNAGFYDTLRACILNFVRGDVSGRLLTYDLKTRETRVLLDNLFYANGVAVAHDESYVLVVETWAYRVLRVWLKGEKAGKVDTFMDRLPGAPDGLSRSKLNHDCFWVCLVAKVSPLGKLAPYPLVRQIVGKLLVPSLPKLAKRLLGSTAALQVQSDGSVVKTYLDSKSQTLQSISGVTEYNGAVFFGSLSGDYVSVMKTD